MTTTSNRRAFLWHALTGGACASGWLGGARRPSLAQEQPSAEFPPLTVIGGPPRERGRLYGRSFRDGIHQFLEREILQAFVGKPATREQMLRYAGACGKVVRDDAPEIHDELEGMAEGAGLSLENLVLITLHEELYHRGVLPKVEHCTAVAVGPPETRDGHTYVGQTWDWMPSVFGMSTMVRWQRTEGPSLLAYAFPGLWVGAGLNAAGLALCWTSASLGDKALGARVGIPSYLLLTHLLYQESLEAVAAEAQRATNAGWFTFVLADGNGNLLNVEGSPERIVVEPATGHLARVGFGSRSMTRTSTGTEVPLHPRCKAMNALLDRSAGRTDRRTLQEYFEDPKHAISVGKSTIDMMVYDTTARQAFLSRGPSYGASWKRFAFT